MTRFIAWTLALLLSCGTLARAEDPLAAKNPFKTTLNRHSLNELRQQLLACPEVGLGPIGLPTKAPGAKKATAPDFALTREYLEKRADLRGLPVQMGDACKMDATRVDAYRSGARLLRLLVSRMKEGNGDDPEILAKVLIVNMARHRLFTETDNELNAIPVLMQMLAVEEPIIRGALVEYLQLHPQRAATKALTRLALYDPAPEVRQKALTALGQPSRYAELGELLDLTGPADLRKELLAGLRHPWAQAQQHAAEALVALADRDAVPALEKLAHEPDPRQPFRDPTTKTWQVREMVRVNHLTNCLLCHAPAEGAPRTNGAELFGVVPVPGEPLPPPTAYYARGDVFVRANFVYLRQDFSLLMPVKEHGKWPELQRFDFIVRTRPATEADHQRQLDDSYQQAIRFALGKLRSSGREVAASGAD